MVAPGRSDALLRKYCLPEVTRIDLGLDECVDVFCLARRRSVIAPSGDIVSTLALTLSNSRRIELLPCFCPAFQQVSDVLIASFSSPSQFRPRHVNCYRVVSEADHTVQRHSYIPA